MQTDVHAHHMKHVDKCFSGNIPRKLFQKVFQCGSNRIKIVPSNLVCVRSTFSRQTDLPLRPVKTKDEGRVQSLDFSLTRCGFAFVYMRDSFLISKKYETVRVL